ncbi:MAG: phosphonate ABC transporter ATP-binding protein [Candidatus Tectomicrobia bacterium]|nr:phosphonate ABC transporter ATP-binding protein [Candidatus Tectomicrobia bacterium]
MYNIHNLTKIFGKNLIAVKNISIKIERGEKVALIGPSGAGKTTLFRLFNCTLRPSSGELWVNGQNVLNLTEGELRRVRAKIGTVYQQHNLVPGLRVIHNVLAGNLGRWSLIKSFWSLISPREIDTAFGALRRVGIPEKLYTRTNELSGGQQQRVAIARVLVQDPEVILADEPVSSLDPPLARSLIQLLVQIAEEGGKTLLVNLHTMHLAMEHFPRIIGFREGTVLFDSPPEEVSEEMLKELYAGTPSLEAMEREEERDLSRSLWQYRYRS